MRLVELASRRELQKGDILTDFRGTKFILRGISAPKRPGSTGKILVTPIDDETAKFEYLPGLFNTEIVTD